MKLLTGWTNVNVLFGNIAEILLAEAAFDFASEVWGFWQRDRDARLFAYARPSPRL